MGRRPTDREELPRDHQAEELPHQEPELRCSELLLDGSGDDVPTNVPQLPFGTS